MKSDRAKSSGFRIELCTKCGCTRVLQLDHLPPRIEVPVGLEKSGTFGRVFRLERSDENGGYYLEQ